MGQVNNIEKWIKEVHSWLDYLELKENPHIEELVENTRFSVLHFEETYEETVQDIEELKFKKEQTRYYEDEGDR